MNIIMRLLTVYFVLFCSVLTISGQEELKNYELSGYVKNLQSLILIDNPDYPANGDKKLILSDNLLHNRLNFRYFPSESFTFVAEARNRFFWGDQVRIDADAFRNSLDANNDYFDLSIEGANEIGVAAQIMIDRFYLEYNKNDLEIKLGRQRINWGISTIWNPNDIFNAYSFTDFDYEERPGSDALRAKYYLSYASSIEFASKIFDKWDDAVFGLLWKTNLWEYDFQFLAGITSEKLSLGNGWAGNIGDAGLKGEWTYFHPLNDSLSSSFSATVNFDYMFSNSIYLATGFLYSKTGKTKGTLDDLFSFELSADNLYPFKYSTFIQASYPLSPLINGGLAIIYSPAESHPLFLNPTFTFSIAENWDIDMVGQFIFNKDNTEKFTSPITALFFRTKWSY